MAANLLLAFLALQWIFQLPLLTGDELDEATRERMGQRAEYLNEEMMQLLQKLEQMSPEQQSPKQSDFAWGALLFATLQQWHFWAVARILVLLLGLCWWLRQRIRRSASCSKEGSSGEKVDKEEQEEKPGLALHARLISAERLLELSESFTMVEDLVNDLLRICHKVSRDTLMPRVKPAVGMESALGGWGPHEDDAIYRLLVPLKPPHGHAFHLELGTPEGTTAKYSCIRAELECSCTKERLAKDMPCFLHCNEEQLRRNWGPSLLGTLCTGPYLDVEKTTRWFQDLVRDAWVVLPQSVHCHLKVLPSKRSCKLRLTDASGSTVLIHMMLGVQQGDSYTLLSIE